MEGVGGFAGSVFWAPPGVTMFNGYCENVKLKGLAFRGQDAKGFEDLTGNYQAYWLVEDCEFWNELTQSFRGNLAVSEFRKCRFGYSGGSGSTHSHIRSQGNLTYASNANKINGCSFFKSQGAGTGVYFTDGFGLTIRDCQFEDSSTAAITALGIQDLCIENNYFERIAFSSVMEFGNAPTIGGSTSNAVIADNVFSADAANVQFVNCTGAASFSFFNNKLVGGYAGSIGNSSNSFIIRDYGNNFGGLGGNWDVATHRGNAFVFPATQVSSADVNTLDDYEEGTWTPVLNGFTVSGTPVLTGSYTKVGRLVYVYFSINPNGGTVASVVGTSYVSGLPFPTTIRSTGAVVNNTTAVGDGVASLQGNFIYTPSWGASANIREGSATYQTAT